MQVLGAGFGRTGTSSLKEALEILGYGPCYHMEDVAENPERIRSWRAAAGPDPVDWDEIFAGFESAVDWPAAAFWRELVSHYPDAKVILTVRDPALWYESAVRTIFSGPLRAEGQPGQAIYRILQRLRPRFGAFTSMVEEAVHNRVFDVPLSHREEVIATFERHIREVQAEVPADRLLTYDVKDGWAPLCAFLGVAVPDRPFPRSNDTKTYQREQRKHATRMLTGR
jgi:hypothetical protein